MAERFKIALIGEAYGEQEALYKLPFVGPAGQELDRMLGDAGIVRKDCFVTNTFNLQPLGNNLENLCGKKTDGDVLAKWQPLLPGLYLKAHYESEIARLLAELERVRPNVAVLLGNTAAWALLEDRGVKKIRGTCRASSRLPWLKCLPTYHPAAVLRQYDLRHTTVIDLIKAKREGEFPEIRRPARTIYVAESIQDIRDFAGAYLALARRIAFDIETDRGEQITCISFAPSIDRVLVIPFTDPRKPKANYWPDLNTELLVWDEVQKIFDLPAEKLGQNTLFDIQYCWMKYGLRITNYSHDTMLLHHSLQPESEKGLGFLGSIYTDEPAWKADRPRGGDQLKRED